MVIQCYNFLIFNQNFYIKNKINFIFLLGRLSFPNIVVDNHNEESLLVAHGEKGIDETAPNFSVVVPTE